MTTEAMKALDALIARIRAEHSWMRITLSTAGDGPGEWAPIEAFATPELRDRATRAFGDRTGAGSVPTTVLGNYLFRDLTYYPLLVAGCCFAGERRVLLLDGAFEFRLDEPGPTRIRAARFAVLPGDPLAGEPGVEVEPDEGALTERLHAEVRALCGPLVACFHAAKYVAPANGWGSVLDALVLGFTTAGGLGLGFGLDEAWARWDAAIAGRSFPVRRRPRRLRYEWAPGQHDEVAVRAGCCLWYVTDEAKTQGRQEYCATCYLKTDEQRIQSMVEWKQQVAAEAATAET